MASLLSTHTPIEVIETKSGNTELTLTIPEAATQVFLRGTPVMLNSGNIQAWDGATVSHGIAGVSLEDAHNLASAGLGAPGAFTTVGYPGTGLVFGSVPNQPNAVNIPEGAPFVQGTITFAQANYDTVFRAMTDNNGGGATTPTQANVGTQYGMSKDTNGLWYVDFGKTTVGTNTVLILIALDPIDGSIANARVLFQFTASAFSMVL